MHTFSVAQAQKPARVGATRANCPDGQLQCLKPALSALSYFQTSELLYGFVRKRLFSLILVTPISLLAVWLYWSMLPSEKAKPVKKRGRNATGPRSLRDASHDATKAPKIANRRSSHADNQGSLNGRYFGQGDL